MKKLHLFFSFTVIILIIGTIVFKPYMKYEKIVDGSKSYQIRTNLITGKTEILSPYTLRWISEKDIADKKQDTSSVNTAWEKVKERRMQSKNETP